MMTTRLDRRTLMTAALGLAAAPLALRAAFAAEGAPALKIASVKYGSLSWLLETIKAEKLDQKYKIAFDIVEIASNQGSAVALYGGSADVVVSDWTWGMRQRAMGEPLKFSPFSSALGAIMVADASPIKTYNDLAGKRLGVAGSAIDKSWLLLRAYSIKTHGKDIAAFANPQYGAAPLLAEQLKDGRIDASLNFWTFAARLKGTGFRSILSMSDVMVALGIEPQPALVGFMWKEATESAQPAAIKGLLNAAAEANQVLAKQDGAWDRLKPLMNAANEGEFQALRDGYRRGIPGPWTEADMKSAEKIMDLLIKSGDTDLVGNGTRFDSKLFYAQPA
jgi:NitT/TauT family transport system substrate-binding protein